MRHIWTCKCICMSTYMHRQGCMHGRIHLSIYATYMYMYEKRHIPYMECITSTYMCIYWHHACSHVCHTYMWHISFFRMGRLFVRPDNPLNIAPREAQQQPSSPRGLRPRISAITWRMGLSPVGLASLDRETARRVRQRCWSHSARGSQEERYSGEAACERDPSQLEAT